MKSNKVLLVVGIFILLLAAASSCALRRMSSIQIVDMKMTTGVDANLMPLNDTSAFAKNTASVSCWFKWQTARLNTPVTARWYYLDDDIHILDYAFTIPRKEGMGSVSLSMPAGKVLPSGSYRIDLNIGRKVLKSATFKVE